MKRRNGKKIAEYFLGMGGRQNESYANEKVYRRRTIQGTYLKAEIFAHPTRKFLQAWIELGIEHLFTMYRIKNCEAVYWTMERNFEPKEIIKF